MIESKHICKSKNIAHSLAMETIWPLTYCSIDSTMIHCVNSIQFDSIQFKTIESLIDKTKTKTKTIEVYSMCLFVVYCSLFVHLLQTCGSLCGI